MFYFVFKRESVIKTFFAYNSNFNGTFKYLVFSEDCNRKVSKDCNITAVDT